MTSKYQTYGILALIVVLGLSVSSCSRKLYEEGNLTQSRLQVEETKFSETIDAAEFDARYASALGLEYEAGGQGPVHLSVLYDPQSRTNTAMRASQEAPRIAGLMRENGIQDIKADIIPVKGLGDQAQAMISFTSYVAHGPKDCGLLPGFNDTDVGFQEEYKLGCTVETVMARQVARPKDLAGNAADYETSDGRRASNIVDVNRSGVQNKPLQGQTASDN